MHARQRASRSRRRTLVPALAVAAATLLSGCTAAADAPLPAQDRALWAMPLDAYTMSTAQTSARDYAENLLVQPCMEAAGLSWDVPVRDVDEAPPATTNAVGERLFTSAIAASVGYHLVIADSPSARAWNAFMNAPASEETVEQLSQCRTEVAEPALPAVTEEMRVAQALSAEATAAAETSDTVRAAATDWTTCMADAGIADLPESITDMPTGWIDQKFGLSITKRVSAEEIELAVQDADCRESSGVAETLYAEQWRLELEALSEHGAELTAARAAIAEQDARARAIIAEHTPATS